jgi:predicted acetyltransferase
VISCLFPASLALYRSVGFEIAGSYVHRRFPAADVAAIDGGRDVDVRRGTAADLVAVHRCHSAHVRSRDGAVSRSPQEWATRLPSDLRDTVLHVVDAAGRPGEIDGYAAWRPGSGRPPYDYSVVVSDVVADDPEIVRALWRVVASSGTQAPDLHVIGPADDDLLLLVPRAAPDVVRSELRWMLRLVDAPAAVAARGWPAAVAGRVDLEVHDDDAPWNAGRWVLEVGGGTAELRPGGSGAVGVSIGALSSWWAGGATASRLRRAGHLVGDPVAVAAMDELVGSAPPVLTDFF